MISITLLVVLCLAAILSNVSALDTLSITGSKFFTSAGSQFFIKGVAYQLVQNDPLTNTNQCQLDAALMKQLGANTIRVYHVDAAGDHTGCMNAFASAGIYLFVDLDSQSTEMPYTTGIREADGSSWTQNKSDAYRAVMDNFQQFENTAGFFVGNEVLNGLADSQAAPYLLAAVADMKTYSKAKGYRTIPIGYSATDTAVLRPMLADYLVCRPNATERLDFYSLNSYEWCGASATYMTSGYSQLQASAVDYPIPIFFSEDGCNTVPPRDFNDQSAIFGSNMVNTWSGAIIYEWIQETNDYGLVNYGVPQAATVVEGSSVIDGFSRQGTPTPVAPDFTNLQGQWATLTPTGIASSAYSPSIALPACPTSSVSGWTIDPSAALPTIGAAGITEGTPSNVPKGSITTGTTSASSSSNSGSASATSSAAKTSATAKGAGGKTTANPLSSGETGFLGMAIALLTVGAGVVFLL